VGMPEATTGSEMTAEPRATADGLTVALAGRWRMSRPRPAFAPAAAAGLRRIRFEAEGVTTWDSALPLYVAEVLGWARRAGVDVDLSGLPPAVRGLAERLATGDARTGTPARSESFLHRVGLAAVDIWKKTREIATFVGECVLAAVRVARQPGRFRWRDCLLEMEKCGAMALPIVSLISLLVGLIMAYQAAVQLRQFGADIYVADLVGLAVVREMGPMMAAVILAGRTGAAFAATLGNMKAGEEIDALECLGIAPVDFLVLPRLVALGLMMPLLALYANLLGILGGMLVAKGILDIPPAAYWVETTSIVDLSDVSTGLIKAAVFGLLIGLSGCLRGLQAERSAAGVGNAATSAVVTAILLIIVADALFAVVFNILGL
jgi:phospholipid/cholesterol/gamma-HCH transport system permease protein